MKIIFRIDEFRIHIQIPCSERVQVFRNDAPVDGDDRILLARLCELVLEIETVVPENIALPL